MVSQVESLASGHAQRTVKFNELTDKVDKQSFKLDDLSARLHELTVQVQTLREALMGIAPGQDRSFIDRTTRLVQQVESGGWFFNGLIGTAKVVIAIGAIIGGWYAAVRFGLMGN